MEVIGDILCGSEVDLMWENGGTLMDISGEKASLQTPNIILAPREYKALGDPGRSS